MALWRHFVDAWAVLRSRFVSYQMECDASAVLIPELTFDGAKLSQVSRPCAP